MTAMSRSSEMTPRATGIGRYVEASGTIAAGIPSEVNGSRIAVATWTATKTIDSSASDRWSSTVRNRGQPAPPADDGGETETDDGGRQQERDDARPAGGNQRT